MLNELLENPTVNVAEVVTDLKKRTNGWMPTRTSINVYRSYYNEALKEREILRKGKINSSVADIIINLSEFIKLLHKLIELEQEKK